ncbi:hypothetical protein [Muricoccus radiodurans]|uniref:hypothetical protein n=1 Tax=Muricoccus radiodurans TaxID=2231721 RepID=UPI003CF6FE89
MALMSRSARRAVFLLGLALGAPGCARPPAEAGPVPVARSAQDLRVVQNRVVATGNGEQVMRAMAATLQDRGFRMAEVDVGAGRIAATRWPFQRITLQQRRLDAGRTGIEADAYVRIEGQDVQVDDPRYYETDLFGPLSQALGLPLGAAAP